MMTLGTVFVLMFVAFSHTLHRTVSQDSLSLSTVEDNRPSTELLTKDRCVLARCQNQRGFLLKMCIDSICSSASVMDDRINDFSDCVTRPCETKVGQRKQEHGCLMKECPGFLSNLPTDIAQYVEEPDLSSEIETASYQTPVKSDLIVDLSRERKACIRSCLNVASRLGTRIGSCVTRLCSLKSSTDNNVVVRKRWGSRVCMENHCGSVESNFNAYVACGIAYCG